MKTSRATSLTLLTSIVLGGALHGQASLLGVGPAANNQSTVFSVETRPYAAKSLRDVSVPNLEGIDVQPRTARLFAIGNDDRLYHVDATTGATTLIGRAGFPFLSGIAFAADGTLYGAAASTATSGVDTLIRIDPTTGRGTRVGAFGVTDITSIAFNPLDDAFWAIRGGTSSRLYDVNRRTGRATADNQITGVTGWIEGLTIDCAGRAYGSGGPGGGGQILEISLSSGIARVYGTIANRLVTGLVALRSPDLSGGCGAPGGTICDATTPRIGQTWEVQESIAITEQCGGPRMMLIGLCNRGGLPIGGLACRSCTGCQLRVFPVVLTFTWDNLVGSLLPIPNDAGLVGANFCAQSPCLDISTTACMCLSNTLSVTVRR